jgi:hypothetical protein
MYNQEDHGQNEQEMDHPACYVEGEPSYAPHTQQNEEQNKKQKIADHVVSGPPGRLI